MRRSTFIGFDGHKVQTKELWPGLELTCRVFPGNGWRNWRAKLRPQWWLSRALWPFVEATVSIQVKESGDGVNYAVNP